MNVMMTLCVAAPFFSSPARALSSLSGNFLLWLLTLLLFLWLAAQAGADSEITASAAKRTSRRFVFTRH